MVHLMRSHSISHRTGHTAWRLIRALLVTLFLGAGAIATATLTVVLLVHITLNMFAGPAGRHELTWFSVFGCSACLIALAVVSVLALGYLTCLFIDGWRDDNSNSTNREEFEP